MNWWTGIFNLLIYGMIWKVVVRSMIVLRVFYLMLLSTSQNYSGGHLGFYRWRKKERSKSHLLIHHSEIKPRQTYLKTTLPTVIIKLDYWYLHFIHTPAVLSSSKYLMMSIKRRAERLPHVHLDFFDKEGQERSWKMQKHLHQSERKKKSYMYIYIFCTPTT